MPRKFVTLDVEEISNVTHPANKRKYLVIKAARDERVERATWTAAFINMLPDSSFAYISPGGEKDAEGKTTPRALRHLPYRGVDGETPDASHVRNALARLPLTGIPANAKASARRKLLAAAKELEIEVMEKNDHAMPMTTEQQMHHRAWYELWDAFTSSMYQFMEAMREDPATYAPRMVQSIEQFLDHARDMLEIVGMVEKAQPLLAVCEDVCKAGRVMSAERMRRLTEAITALQAILDESMPMEKRKGVPMADKTDKDVETPQQRLVALEAEQATLKADNATLKNENITLKGALAKATMTPEEQETEYLKGLPDVIRQQREADKLEKADLRKKLQEAEDRNTKQDYIAKAAKYKALPINPDDDWEVFKAIGGLPEKHRDRIEQLFRSAEELCAKAKVFEAVGTGGGVDTGGSTAYAQLEALATELQKGTALTKEQAIAKASSVRPDLVKQHRDERKETRDGR